MCASASSRSKQQTKRINKCLWWRDEHFILFTSPDYWFFNVYAHMDAYEKCHCIQFNLKIWLCGVVNKIMSDPSLLLHHIHFYFERWLLHWSPRLERTKVLDWTSNFEVQFLLKMFSAFSVGWFHCKGPGRSVEGKYIYIRIYM